MKGNQVLRIAGINLAIIGIGMFVVDNAIDYFAKLNRYNKVERDIHIRHSGNINVKESPPLSYINISNRNLHSSPIKFRTSVLGDILPRGGKGDCKVFFIGGSTTESHWMPEKKRWHYIIGENLGSDIQTYNFGVGGYNLMQNKIKLEAYLLAHNPNVIVNMNQINDISKFINSDFSRDFYYSEVNTLHGMYNRKYINSFFILRVRRSLENIFPTITSKWRRYRNRNRSISKRKIDREYSKNERAQIFKEKFKTIFIPTYMSQLNAISVSLSSNNIALVVLSQPNRVEIISNNQEFIKITPDESLLRDQMQEAGLSIEVLAWSVQELREAIKSFISTSKQNHIHYIEDATAIEINSKNFYDSIHYSEIGSGKFASLLTNSFKSLLSNELICKP